MQFKTFFPGTFSVTEAQIKGCRVNTEDLIDILPAIGQQQPPQVSK
ncbi:hypothetical protein [uncultured Photobacterium sp.]|nr:hypothetical protein [uncultured Photobacterium sp.]